MKYIHEKNKICYLVHITRQYLYISEPPDHKIAHSCVIADDNRWVSHHSAKKTGIENVHGPDFFWPATGNHKSLLYEISHDLVRLKA